MTLYLKPDVHAVAIGADLAVLDIPADAYLCLPGAAAVVADSGSAAIARGPFQAALAEGGLLSAAPPPARRTPPPSPRRSILHASGAARPDGRALLAAAGVVADVRRARRGRGLAAYLALADADRDLSRNVETATAAARLFWTIGPWLPLDGECLLRSAMLVVFLRRLGLAADWVFGVRLWPFGAHCWVQAGDVCLNDDVERLRAYTPIYWR